MYSPFSDSKGRPLAIEKVKFSHLSQLVDCDEGHHVEYKLLLEDGGKAQLAKEITSFANCEGGWLIVGVDDKTKEIKPIDKQDSANVSERLRHAFHLCRSLALVS